MSELIMQHIGATTTLSEIKNTFPDFFWNTSQPLHAKRILFQKKFPIRPEALAAYTHKYERGEVVIDRQVEKIELVDGALNIAELTVWWMCRMQTNEQKFGKPYHGFRSMRTASETSTIKNHCWCVYFVANEYLEFSRNKKSVH
jgi:hypothetical protein